MPTGAGAGRAGLFECWAELLLAAVAIRSPWRERYLTPARVGGRDTASVEQSGAALQRLHQAAARHFRPMSCLERSAAAQRILRRRQVPAELRVGVRRTDGEAVEAHAWIEVEGVALDTLAGGFAPLERRSPRLAGVRLRGDARLCLPDDGTETDVESAVVTGPPPAPQSGEWHRLPPHPAGGQAWVRGDGGSIALDGGDENDGALSALLRWAVPFAAALQGRVTLHASAVSRGRGVWAFVGPSGVGKSTLARAFATRGWQVAADDLLPCREHRAAGGTADTEGKDIVALCGQERPALRGLFFLERTRPADEPHAERLSPADTLHRLLRHGFGELRSEPLWRSQFAFYGKLAERADAYRLHVPSDLARVDHVVSVVEGRIEP